MFIIGLGGPSGTGKTTVAKEAAKQLAAQTISMESYYADQSRVPAEQRAQHNFDAPDAVDAALLAEHVRAFAAGHDIQVPIYDFAENTRVAGRHELIRNSPILIVEGILVLHWPELRSVFDLNVYLDASDEVCFHRRKVRDIVERQRSSDFVTRQYEETVRPMAAQHVYPTRRYANVVIDASEPIADVVSALVNAAKMQQKKST